MLELPKYVKRQKKKNGREFFYYERFRNTDRAWPRIPLPTDPHNQEFWLRCEQTRALKAHRDDSGVWHWSYQTEHGREYLLPDPGENSTVFWQAIDSAIEKEKKLLSKSEKTFQSLISEYKEHTAYKTLGSQTKVDYDRHLALIQSSWGEEPVDSLTTVEAQTAIDSFQDTPATARIFRVVLKKLISFGIPRGYSTFNPITDTEKVKYKPDPYIPWPDWAFELFFQHARIGLHLPVYSAVFTGQRSIDVITMRRPKLTDDAIRLVARKTKKEVWVPVHSEYRTVLKTAWIDKPALHLREDGADWTVAAFRTAWQREFSLDPERELEVSREAKEKATAMKRLRKAKIVFHGLRKNAVCMLLEVGCTEGEVAAIVEMSEVMVRHYARDVNKRRLALNGMKKLEDGWSEMRKAIFGASVDGV